MIIPKIVSIFLVYTIIIIIILLVYNYTTALLLPAQHKKKMLFDQIIIMGIILSDNASFNLVCANFRFIRHIGPDMHMRRLIEPPGSNRHEITCNLL